MKARKLKKRIYGIPFCELKSGVLYRSVPSFKEWGVGEDWFIWFPTESKRAWNIVAGRLVAVIDSQRESYRIFYGNSSVPTPYSKWIEMPKGTIVETECGKSFQF